MQTEIERRLDKLEGEVMALRQALACVGYLFSPEQASQFQELLKGIGARELSGTKAFVSAHKGYHKELAGDLQYLRAARRYPI